MTGRLQQLRAPSLSSLEESEEIYLQTLRTNATDSTFLSHQNALRKFFSWYSSQVDRTKVPEKALAEFSEHLLNGLDLGIDTVVGHVHSLLNYLAFHHQSSPDMLRVRLVPEIQSLPCSESERETLVNEFGCHANQEITRSVDALQTYLRQRQYGTRTHAYVEFIHTTTARPTQVHALNRSDLNLDEQTASIALPETYIVSTNGLHEERTATLPPHLTDLLDAYLEYERDTPPALTASHCSPRPTGVRTSGHFAAASNWRANRHKNITLSPASPVRTNRYRHPRLPTSFQAISGGPHSTRSWAANDGATSQVAR